MSIDSQHVSKSQTQHIHVTHQPVCACNIPFRPTRTSNQKTHRSIEEQWCDERDCLQEVHELGQIDKPADGITTFVHTDLTVPIASGAKVRAVDYPELVKSTADLRDAQTTL